MLEKNKEIYFAFVPIMLTIIIAQQFDILNSLWCAVSTYVVYRERVNLSVEKGIFRMLGYTLGTSVAIDFVRYLEPNIILVCISVFILAMLCVYYNNTTHHGFAWIYFCLAFFITSSQSVSPYIDDLDNYALVRATSVIFGSMMAIIFIILRNISEFNMLIKSFSDKSYVKEYMCKGYRVKKNADLFFYCLSAAIALVIIVVIGSVLNKNLFLQAGTAILFIINVPFITIQNQGRQAVYEKIKQRFMGATVGVIFGIVAFLLLQKNDLLFYPLIAAVVIFSLYFKTSNKYSYFGLQTYVAFVFVMLPKPLFNDPYYELFSRATGLFFGMLALGFSTLVSLALKKIYYYLKNHQGRLEVK